MAKKKERPTGFASGKCDKCDATAHTKVGEQHRRCGGSKGASIKAAGKKLPRAQRGTWA